MKKPKGIYYQSTSDKWIATIQCQKKSVHIGLYKNDEIALEARKLAEEVKKDLGKRCRRYHIIEALNKWREGIGMKPLRQNAK